VLKILVVTPVFWPESFRINDLVQAWVEQGHEVEILTGTPNYPHASQFPNHSWCRPLNEMAFGARIMRAPVFPRGRARAIELGLHYLSFVVMGSLRLLLHRGNDWDRIFVFQTSPVTVVLPAFLARMWCRAPVVMWVQDLWPEAVTSSGMVRNQAIGMILKLFSSNIYRGCNRLVTQSKAFLEILVARGVPASRIAYVPNWAEDFYLSGVNGSEVGYMPGQPFTVLFAGNLGRGQGAETILQAMLLLKSHPLIRWRLVGEGALKPWLQAQVADLGLGSQVEFIPACPPEAMPPLFAKADALLVCLRKDPVYTMTVPGKLQSYMASGRPVLGCIDGEGAGIIRESGAGLVAPAEDAEALAAQVCSLMELGYATRAAMGTRGRAWFLEHYLRSVCIAQLEEELAKA